MACAALAPSALAQAARAAARRLPREIVDDAEQEAWVRWLAAGGQAGMERQQADACAYLVGVFHHVCADAVRAHRRRQRWCALAADVGVEPMELVDERAAHGLGGASSASSSRWCAPHSPICRWRTSISGSLPRSRAAVGTRLERQPGWTGRRSADRGREF
jgi:hypothetical protein